MEIKRDYYLQKLIDRENNGLIKIVTGIRRCGKSYLLNTIFHKQLCIAAETRKIALAFLAHDAIKYATLLPTSL